MKIFLALILAISNIGSNVDFGGYTGYQVFETLGYVESDEEFANYGEITNLLHTLSELQVENEEKLTFTYVLEDEELINREGFAVVLSDYLRYVDKFEGAIAGVKNDISGIENYEYEVVSLYCMGIITDSVFMPLENITLEQACEYVARAVGIKERENIEVLQNYLPIVMYHSINDDQNSWSDYTISSQTFENDLVYLEKNGYTTLLVQDLIDILQNGEEFPQKPILITFDDGYEDNYIYAFSLLQKYEQKAIIAPIIKHYYEEVSTSLKHLTLEQTIEMHNSGLIEYGNHTYDSHENITGERYGVLKWSNESYSNFYNFFTSDIAKTHEFYTENELSIPVVYAYPFGAYTDDNEKIIKEYGYLASFTTAPALVNVVENLQDLFELNRLNRPTGISTEEFFQKLEMMDIK
ncbi:MAG: polysaccharide deacetylase family protein [Clostridia bacterium]